MPAEVGLGQIELEHREVVRELAPGLASGLLNTAQELGASLGLGALSALAVAASPGGGTGTYRVGFLAAAVTCLVVLGLSLRAARDLGREESPVTPEPEPALVPAGGA